MNTKKKMIFLVHMPPPVHGVSMINSWIKNSKLINDTFEIDYMNLSLSSNVSELNKFSALKLIKLLRQYLRIISMFLKNDYELFYITLNPVGGQFYKEAPFIALSKLFHIPVLSHIHTKGVRKYIGSSSVKRKIYEFVMSKTSIIHLSKSLLDDLTFINVIDKKYVLPNGIPNVPYTTRKSNDNKLNLLLVSNLIPSKGAFTLIKVADQIQKKRPEIDLSVTLVGAVYNMDYLNEMKNYISYNNLENVVKFKGSLTGINKDKEFMDADIFVFPTYYSKECFPLVVLEAFSFGLPVISTNEGALGEIIDNGINGYIDDFKDLEKASSRIIGLADSRNILKRMGDNAIQCFQEKYQFVLFEQNLSDILDIISSKN